MKRFIGKKEEGNEGQEGMKGPERREQGKRRHYQERDGEHMNAVIGEGEMGW